MADESAPDDTTEIRRKATVRLGIAAGVTAIALGGLWWLDHASQEPAPAKPPAPTPIVSAPTAAPPATPVEAPEVVPEDGRQAPVEEAPATPPPPPAPAMARPAPTAAKTARPTEEAPTRREPAPAARPGTPPPAAGDYVVQLGVFTNPGNAQELVERLKKQGIRAYTETRVQVGPFKNKAEAEKAQVELKRIGISGLLGTTK